MAIDDKWRKLLWAFGIVLGLGLLAFLVYFFAFTFPGKRFMRDFFNWRTAKKTAPYIFGGLWITIEAAVISECLILVAGLSLALVRISRVRLLRAMAAIYIDVIRGIPLLVQIFIVYFGLGAMGFKSRLWSGVFALTICYAAYEAEIFRAGIESIHKGQMEAARSLGMGYLMSMRYVVLPQAIRNVIPPLSNEFIALLKDTALLSAIGVLEVTRRATEMQGHLANSTPLMVAAVCYLIVTIPLMRVVQYVNKRLAVRD